jgi:hypothetical protein
MENQSKWVHFKQSCALRMYNDWTNRKHRPSKLLTNHRQRGSLGPCLCRKGLR